MSTLDIAIYFTLEFKYVKLYATDEGWTWITDLEWLPLGSLGFPKAIPLFPTRQSEETKGGKLQGEKHGVTYHLIGVPLRTGSLYPGSEDDAQAYRETHLMHRLEAVGCRVIDEGDVPIPNYLPHHSIPPIRNWPGPRIAWDCVREFIEPYLREPGHIPLLIGGDCSIVVGTTHALMGIYGEGVHILYLDGHIDGVAPQPERCSSGAMMALWLTTQASSFRAGPTLSPSQVTVIGWSDDQDSKPMGLQSMSLTDVRRLGPSDSAQQALKAIPADAPILLHFDIDVLNKQEMPASYFPPTDGLSIAEVRELLSILLADERVQIIEVTEYASLRDLDQSSVSRIGELLAAGLKIRCS
jgi:arginase